MVAAHSVVVLSESFSVRMDVSQYTQVRGGHSFTCVCSLAGWLGRFHKNYLTNFDGIFIKGTSWAFNVTDRSKSTNSWTTPEEIDMESSNWCHFVNDPRVHHVAGSVVHVSPLRLCQHVLFYYQIYDILYLQYLDVANWPLQAPGHTRPHQAAAEKPVWKQ